MAITNFDYIAKGAKPPIPASDKETVDDYIEEAEMILAERVGGDLASWAAAAPGRDLKVKRVVKRMVRRVLKNPDGFESETEGDYSYTRARALRSGEIYASTADWKMLGLARRRVGTIRLGLPADSPRNINGRPCR